MKKGFTLIELLAVIVILAIIALIATPIVLEIINQSKESAQLRSAEMYLKGVETSVATATLNEQNIPDNTYPITKHGDVCLVDLTNTNECPTKENTLEIQMNGEKPSSGTVTIASGKVTDIAFTYSNKKTIVKENNKLVFADEEETVVVKTLSTMCSLADGSTANQVGAKYSCDFGAGAKNFYILELGTNPVSNTTLESDEVALILEGNYDTTTQAWCDQSGANPSNNVCAADGLTSKLDEIAGAWTELERDQIGLPSMEQIMVADGKSETKYTGYTSLSNSWLYSWDNSAWGNTVVGYWSSSPSVDDSSKAWLVPNNGWPNDLSVSNGGEYGVRPVITLKI